MWANVGVVSGGTSVNAIAQQAEFLLDMRSEKQEALLALEAAVTDICRRPIGKSAKVHMELIGERPCGEALHGGLTDILEPIRTELGLANEYRSASTDANIPLSLGIPALCFGIYLGHGAHTMEEYIEMDSVALGLEILLRFALA